MTDNPVLPLPPFELAARTGGYDGSGDFWAQWAAVGSAQADIILSYLPQGWTESPRRVLDFGCGSGRTVRSFIERSLPWDLWGCDIDRRSISWLCQNLDPPGSFFEVTESPALQSPDQFFDLVYAMSVFTHITETWSGWLLELHRVLKPDGLALVSFLGRGMIGPFANEEWNADLIGMNVIRAGKDWDSRGPIVFHSEWWIRSHWGRAFDILRLDDHDEGHGLVLMRKRSGQPSPADLEQPDVGDPREWEALRHNLVQLHREDALLRRELMESREQLKKEVAPTAGAGAGWSELARMAWEKLRVTFR